ncbi:MAG: hypothetical protein M0Z67_11095 [Nitrospiraceae bacterium]|nr:hypothetical protein [Nitrospiraceae bacterium]
MLEFTECYLQVIVFFPSCPRFSVGHPCFLKNGFPPKDCGNDGLNTHTLCNVRVKSAEKKVGKTLLAFSCHDVAAATLTPEELAAVQETEKKLGVVLVAVKS